ncbi:uncharacterized protein Dwil_GK28007, partial [Drosophila willistoni]
MSKHRRAEQSGNIQSFLNNIHKEIVDGQDGQGQRGKHKVLKSVKAKDYEEYEDYEVDLDAINEVTEMDQEEPSVAEEYIEEEEV